MTSIFQNMLKHVDRRRGFVMVFSIITVAAMAPFQNITIPGLQGVRGIFPAHCLEVSYGIWFGVWGVMGSFVGGLILNLVWTNSVDLPPFLAVVLSFSDLFMALIPYLIVRYFKVDYSLKTSRDWIIYMIGVILITPLPVSFYSVQVLILAGLLPWQNFWAAMYFWNLGTYIVVSLVTTSLLMLISPMLIRRGYHVSS